MHTLSFAEYLWLGDEESQKTMRAQTRISLLPNPPQLNDFEPWHINRQDRQNREHQDAHCRLRPVRHYANPMESGDHHLVLCEVIDGGGNAHEKNSRAVLRSLLNALDSELQPWLGFRQSYELIPMAAGWPANSTADTPQMLWERQKVGRALAQAHAKACIQAGVLLHSFYPTSVSGHWRFQLGYRGIEAEPCDPLRIADDLWVARYLLQQQATQFGMSVVFDRQRATGASDQYPEQGLTSYFSTAYTRDVRCGLSALHGIIDALPQALTVWPKPISSKQQGITRIDGGVTAKASIPAQVARRGYGYLSCEFGHTQDGGVQDDPYQTTLTLINTISQ